jgi:hypothetical protein
VLISRTVAHKNIFGKRARCFRQNGFFCSGLCYRSADDLACKRPVRPITSFFVFALCYFSFVSSSTARLLFLIEFSFYFRKRGEAFQEISLLCLSTTPFLPLLSEIYQKVFLFHLHINTLQIFLCFTFHHPLSTETVFSSKYFSFPSSRTHDSFLF